MKIRYMIFDFDGTLFDTMSLWDKAGENYLHSLNIEPKPDMLEDIKYLSLYQSAQYLKKEYNLSLSIEQIIEGINKTIEYSYIYEVLPKPGVLSFLKQLKSLNISMCITTATDRYLIEAALKRCHLYHYFDFILTCNEVGHGKDQPLIYRKALDYYHADKKQTIVFEDALYAVNTAKKDGFIVTGVYDQSEKNQQELKQLSDLYIIDYKHTEELYHFIKGGQV